MPRQNIYFISLQTVSSSISSFNSTVTTGASNEYRIGGTN